MADDWKTRHSEVEREFLAFIGDSTPLILKGGTGLMLCYELDRFSEDLDFDSSSQGFSTISAVERFCAEKGYECHVKKDTDAVQRATIHYGGKKPLKVETSYRRASIPDEEWSIVKGIKVYALNVLASMKTTAYSQRDRIRDLYDVSFLVNKYWDSFDASTRAFMANALASKGLEQFELVLAENTDELIDESALTEAFLQANERAGLLSENPAKADSRPIESPELHEAARDVQANIPRSTNRTPSQSRDLTR